MPKLIPLIRAGCLVPHIRWMEARDRPVADLLDKACIPGDPVSDPERPIPLHGAFAFLRDAARREGAPDLGWRVVSEASVTDLGMLGSLSRAEPTPALALAQASRSMPNFCTHEKLSFRTVPGGGIVRVDFAVRTDPEALHQAQLLTLALICGVLAAARPSGVLAERIEIPPHPRAGLRHIPPQIAHEIAAAPAAALVMHIGEAVLHRPLPRSHHPSHAATRPLEAWHRLRAEADFLPATRRLVEAMLDDGGPSASRLAEAAGMGLRTLQRRLAREGTSFSALVDDARRRRALDDIAGGGVPIAEIAGTLGYASPSALTRAVRRWSGQPPRALRSGTMA